MQCPYDDVSLVTTERGGIEVDYCPICRGMWLDRGELDKVIAGGSVDMLSDFEERKETDHDIRHHRKGFLTELFGY